MPRPCSSVAQQAGRHFIELGKPGKIVKHVLHLQRGGGTELVGPIAQARELPSS